MRYLTMFLLLVSCTGLGSHAAASEGYGYFQSMQAALNTPYYARDLTDDEMDDADNRPGGGYSDGKWTGENPPTEEDEDGNPIYTYDEDDDWPIHDWYAAQQVFEDENGTIIILEDDGEITEIEPA